MKGYRMEDAGAIHSLCSSSLIS